MQVSDADAEHTTAMTAERHPLYHPPRGNPRPEHAATLEPGRCTMGNSGQGGVHHAEP